MIDKLDVVVTSASRPKLVPFLMNSFDKYIHYSGKIRKIWHEDCVYMDESFKVIRSVENWADMTIFDNPAKRIGSAYRSLFNGVIKTKYMFNMQDDWEFELPVDIDQILYVMEKNNHINCVYFNKITNEIINHGYERKRENYDGLVLLKNNQFPFLPGIWRTDFVKKHWHQAPYEKQYEGYFNNGLPSDCGSYVYGDVGYPRVVRHLGYTWVVKPYGDVQRKKNNHGLDEYGSYENMDELNSKHRAPWLSIEPNRPRNK